MGSSSKKKRDAHKKAALQEAERQGQGDEAAAEESTPKPPAPPKGKGGKSGGKGAGKGGKPASLTRRQKQQVALQKEAAVKKALEEQQGVVDQLREDLKTAQDETNQAQSDLEDKQRELTDAQGEAHRANEDAETHRKAKEKAEGEARTALSKLETLQQQQGQQQPPAAEEGELAQLREDLETRTRERDEARNEVSRSDQTADQLRTQGQTARDEAASLREQLRDRTKERDDARTEAAQHKQAAEEERQAKEALQKQLGEAPQKAEATAPAAGQEPAPKPNPDPTSVPARKRSIWPGLVTVLIVLVGVGGFFIHEKPNHPYSKAAKGLWAKVEQRLSQMSQPAPAKAFKPQAVSGTQNTQKATPAVQTTVAQDQPAQLLPPPQWTATKAPSVAQLPPMPTDLGSVDDATLKKVFEHQLSTMEKRDFFRWLKEQPAKVNGAYWRLKRSLQPQEHFTR